MATLQPIPRPQSGDDVGDLWKIVDRVVLFANSFLAGRGRIIPSVRNALTICEGGSTFEFVAAAGIGTAAQPYPWQFSPSPWLGTGPDPSASDRAKRFLLADAAVNNLVPSNMHQEFVAFGDVTDKGITQDDAVRTFAYWQANISESQVGQGDFVMDRPEIMLIEGTRTDTLPSLATPPGFGADGSFPAYVIGQICTVDNWGGALHYNVGLKAYQSVAPMVSGMLNGKVVRTFLYASQ